MSSRLRFTIILAVAWMLVSVSARPAPQSTGGGGIISERTGQSVTGEFLEFYEQAENPEVLFGDPISDVIEDPIRPGIKLQYFLRARMELDPDQPEGKRVSLTNLGKLLYDETTRGEPVDLAYSPGVCRVMGSQNIAVCYEFLRFYDQYDGEFYFGDPISSLEKLSTGRLVQYFERARLEWWPENPLNARVVLTNLGYIYQGKVRQSPTDPPTTGPKPFKVVLHAFPARPFVSANSQQTISVIVNNQNGDALEGALVKLVVHTPDGQNISHRLPETNSQGLSQTALAVGPYKPGQMITIDVSVEVQNGGQATTTTYFRIWW